jgi:hypothetical protein
MTSVYEDLTQEARQIWGIALRALETALQAYCDAMRGE